MYLLASESNDSSSVIVVSTRRWMKLSRVAGCMIIRACNSTCIVVASADGWKREIFPSVQLAHSESSSLVAYCSLEDWALHTNSALSSSSSFTGHRVISGSIFVRRWTDEVIDFVASQPAEVKRWPIKTEGMAGRN